MKWLYRAAGLALLIRFDSTLSDIVRRLSVLHELAAHPLRITNEFNTNPMAVLDTELQQAKRQVLWDLEARRAASRPGAVPGPPTTSSPASPTATTEPSAEPASTEAPGRWTLTSGEPMEDWASRVRPSWLVDTSRTSLPTAAGLPVAGDLGPVDPERFTDKAEINASGYQAICCPSLRYPMQDCADHPHVKGERLEARTDGGDD